MTITIESVCNDALTVIGYKRHIGSIWEGTVAARAALDVWARTRDALFLAVKPDWSTAEAPITLVKSAPNIAGETASYLDTPWTDVYPELPWLYEYAQPTDCIWPLQVKTTPITLPVWRPRDWVFRIGNNNTILTNAREARLVYTQRILDPTIWRADFIQMMIKALAEQFKAELAPAMMRQPREAQQNAPNTAG